MKQTPLPADETIPQAALDAGITGACAHPGAPLAEILDCIQQEGACAC